ARPCKAHASRMTARSSAYRVVSKAIRTVSSTTATASPSSAGPNAAIGHAAISTTTAAARGMLMPIRSRHLKISWATRYRAPRPVPPDPPEQRPGGEHAHRLGLDRVCEHLLDTDRGDDDACDHRVVPVG